MSEELLGFLDPRLGRRDGLVFLVVLVVVLGIGGVFRFAEAFQLLFVGDATNLFRRHRRAKRGLVGLRRFFGGDRR